MSKTSKTDDLTIRLQKVIAASGLSSRRAAEELIREGKVTVNGEIVRLLGTCINPVTDHVKVDGTHIETAEPEVFVLLNKPPGCVTTMNDPLGRGTVADLLSRVKVRVFPVGRLDFDAEGLLLLTNNGLVAQACLHPKYHVPKTYVIKVSGVFSDEEIKMLKEGVRLEDGVTSPADVRKSGKAKTNSWLEITIREGKKHQIKRMVEACGHHVIRIKRTRFGPLQLGDLPVGTFRYATDAEANALRGILLRSTTGEKTRTPRRKPYLKNRIKPGDTAASKTGRKPLRPLVSRERKKSGMASANRPSSMKGNARSGIAKRPESPRPASKKSPLDKGSDRRSSLPKRSFNGRGATPKSSGSKGTKRSSVSSKKPSTFRGTSAKPPTARSHVSRTDSPKKSSTRPGGAARLQPIQGNARRSTSSKKPLNPRATSGKGQPFKGKERRPSFTKNVTKSRLSSVKRPSTKGANARSTFTKRGSSPTRKTTTKRRTQKG